jgi:hypothetical protein
LRGEGQARTRTGEPYLDLLGAVLSEGANGNPDYFRMPCGIEWCKKSGLDPGYLFLKAIQYTVRRGEKFTRMYVCYYINKHGEKTYMRRCSH